MDLSIIIPTLNEAAHIVPLIRHLQTCTCGISAEIIVVDGGSTDNTLELASHNGAIACRSERRGRAVQMNYGATKANGNVLYFVHADTLPPASFVQDIRQALEQGFELGCFRFRFDSNRLLLRLNSWFTRFDVLWCRGGDQSLYIRTSVFRELQGFCERHIIMEEYDLIRRARKTRNFRIIPRNILVSARKYDHNSYLRVQVANFMAFNMYRLGFPQQQIYNTYRRMLHY